jgi:uncharacterized membrane protein
METPQQQPFYKARITDVEKITLQNGYAQQNITAEIVEGEAEGTTVHMEYIPTNQGGDVYAEGETVVITKASVADAEQYYIVDHYRLPALGIVAVIFIAAILIFARKRGAFSLVGLCISIAVLGLFIVPRIVDGQNPLIVSSVGAIMIAVTSLYVAHGFSRRTSIALASTLLTIGVAILLSVIFVHIAQLTGLGSEEAYFVQSGVSGNINLQGLLLGGIIIGVLGILDDVTTAQTAAVEEIYKADPTVTRRELYKRSFSVGREHITSLVNTLVLAYAGASLPLFLLFTLHLQPWWVTLNSAFIAEEVIRTLVGSTALTLAVPITTALATYSYIKRKTH